MTGGPKGRVRWLTAGQDLLRDGGVGAVKLQALTDALGLTTGSFYHHFTGMADYLDQLARYYGSDQPVESLTLVHDADPRQRLRRLEALSRNKRMGLLDVAMRDWAGSHPVAAQAVRDADGLLLTFLETAFIDLGFPRQDAQVRAQLFLSAGVARVTPPWQVHVDLVDEVLAILAP